ncbi:MAG TPA: flagellar basal body rod protein FlgB [Patescibacteria group bacterium]|nr:flagellar basal body rod protein FlgB [Patescibacteria group bacterium]
MFEDLTLLAMAKKQMDYLTRRQEVLAENVANANTPNFKTKDLAPLSFKDVMQPAAETVRAVVTNPMHISPEVQPTTFASVTVRRPEETKPNGNEVGLEDQMEKMGNVTNSYTLAINIFQKNIAMLKTAIGKSS